MSNSNLESIVISNPGLTTASSGRRYASMFIADPRGDQDLRVFADPGDKQLFSFQQGDQIEVSVDRSGKFPKTTIITPQGSADVTAQIEKAEAAEAAAANIIEGGIAAVANHYALCLSAVNEDAAMQVAISSFTVAQQASFTQAAASSVFIQCNREGIYT